MSTSGRKRLQCDMSLCGRRMLVVSVVSIIERNQTCHLTATIMMTRRNLQTVEVMSPPAACSIENSCHFPYNRSIRLEWLDASVDSLLMFQC